MGFVFDVMYTYGRPLSLAFMILGAAIFWYLGGRTALRDMGRNSTYLLLLNLYLIVKVSFYGGISIFLQSFFVTIVQICAFVLVVAGYEKVDVANRFKVGFVPAIMFTYALLSISVNIFVFWRFPASSMTLLGGRLFGITANPQHLALQTAFCLPALLFCVQRYGMSRLIGIVAMILTLAAVWIEYLTGSRMGFAAAVAAIAIFSLRFFSKRYVAMTIVAIVTVAPIFSLIFYEDVSTVISERFIIGREDTRSEYWAAGISQFLEYPIFGAEPDPETGRLYFNVSFWISAAASGGIVGIGFAIPLFFRMASCVSKIRSLKREKLIEDAYGQMFVGILIIMFWASIFEAAFLGIFAAHTMIAYVYFSGADANISEATLYGRIRRKYWQSRFARVHP
ncbi:hypothetical protein [Mesorhizobium sp.]|uniref:hypothetical protein n=1 Tax=Mesorhizobium sp. TaxID=1871066 RepID=UPI001205612E|nr:hypothetical protein [Mesorhizobium sp.]TIL54860.1 MAG: hypothetical protein E5Y83_01200 [Mesorhizobium sp.]